LNKSSVEEIRARFDADVERFSDLQTGQSSTMDAPLALELVAQAAVVCTPGAKRICDVGCGAGNFTLKLLERFAGADCTLVDLSAPMLDRAQQRVSAVTNRQVTTLQGDVRELELGEARYDVIVAAAVLHHLRTPDEWRSTYRKLVRALVPGGSLWVFDMVQAASPPLAKLFKQRYGDYLEGLRDAAYRDHVFAYIEQEDSPIPLLDQLDMMREAGLTSVDVLHKQNVFAAFGGVLGSNKS
jgi:tRNA (cmo5U34)-methyltransferase